MKLLFYSFVFLFVSVSLYARKSDFGLPVNIPIILNGNFGELRGNHFHAGIDIKTNGATIPVFSVDDGHISRISVSPSGYGKALYIDHPSGYTSVYAHLEKFSPAVEKWIKEQQYKKEIYTVNLYPNDDMFVVKKGEIVAHSGNSGSSGGPHLHFEIRKTDNEHPVNPLLLGFNINDKSKPVVSNLYVYPLYDESHVQNSFKKKSFELVLSDGVYRPKANSTIEGWNMLGFGIDAVDYLDGNWSKCGIYKMELFVDSQMINSFEINELNFNDMRYLNSHLDYEEYIKYKRKIHKTFIEPGNILEIYHNTKDRGVFNFNDGEKHSVMIKIYDTYLNSAKIQFNLKSTFAQLKTAENYTKLFEYDRKNGFENDEIEVDLPLGVLYTNLNFNYKKIEATNRTCSNIHRLQNKYTPLHKPIEVKILPTKLPENLRNKALLALVDFNSGIFTSIGGEYSFGHVKSTTKEFGDICVVVDTLAPSVTPLSIKDKKTLMEPDRIRFKIKDDLSGIKKYDGFIDDKWVLFEYDLKTNTITYNFDDHIDKGKKHHIKLITEDFKENRGEYNAEFYY